MSFIRLHTPEKSSKTPCYIRPEMIYIFAPYNSQHRNANSIVHFLNGNMVVVVETVTEITEILENNEKYGNI